MSYVEFFTCRVAIQVCVGYFPNGRKRRWTFSMRGIRPDASVESIAAVVRALAPLLIYPIIKVRKVVKRTIIFDAAEFAVPAAAPVVEPVAAVVVAVVPKTPPRPLRGHPSTEGNLPETRCAFIPLCGVVAAGRSPRAPPALLV